MATRRERVVLDLEDNFSAGMARAAAATDLLNRRVNALSKGAVESRRVNRDMGAGFDEMGRSAARASNDIDRMSGRLRLIRDAVIVLGPALVPIGAVGIPALSGLAAQFGFAALAGGVAIGAFQGVGDALKAMNKAHLEPTTANLQAAQIAMEQISPSAQVFVRQLRDLGPALEGLRDTGAAGMFPGFGEGLDALMRRLPDVERIVAAVSGELGNIGAATGDSLASSRWDDFFDFLATDAPSALQEMAQAAGNTGHAMAEMWMAFDPLNDDFSRWLRDSTASLDEWAQGLEHTEGFRNFIDYVQTTGPQVADTFGAIGDAMVQIVQATAPLAGPVLQGLESVAKVIGAVADSDLGTPIFAGLAALTLYNRALGVTATMSKTAWGASARANLVGMGAALTTVASAQQRATLSAGAMAKAEAQRSAAIKSGLITAGKGAAVLGALAVAGTGVAEGVNLSNTAMLGLVGTMAGPWGAAAGATVGTLLDAKSAADETRGALDSLNAAMVSGNADVLASSLRAAKTELADLQKITGVGDLLGTIQEDIGMTLKGQLDGRRKLIEEYQEAIHAASAGNNFAAALDFAASFGETATAAEAATRGVEGFAAAMAGLNNTLTRREAMRQYAESVLDANARNRELGATLTKTGAAFAGQKRAGLESQRTLDRIAVAAVNVAKDMKPLQGARYLQNAHKDFVRLATNMGMSTKSARKLANELFVLDKTEANPKVEEKGAAPSSKRIKELRGEIKALKSKMVKMDEKGAAAARARVAALRAEIERLRSRTVYMTYVRTNITRNVGASGNVGKGNAPDAVAYGGIFNNNVRTFAQGGFGDVANRHMPELAGPGPTRVWREPETQGEAYIPLANDDRRPRAKAIAEETVGLLGGEVEWFARGGRKGGRGGRGDGTGPVRRSLKELTKAAKESAKAITAEKSQREKLKQDRDQLRTSVTGAFTNDPFARGSVASAMKVLQRDTADAKTMKALLQQLKAKGFDGDALAGLAATGDIKKVRTFANSRRTELLQVEALFAQRAQASNAAGAYAGSAAYGAAQIASAKHLATLVKQNAQLQKQLKQASKKQRPINVNGARDPKRTAREVARRERLAG